MRKGECAKSALLLFFFAKDGKYGKAGLQTFTRIGIHAIISPAKSIIYKDFLKPEDCLLLLNKNRIKNIILLILIAAILSGCSHAGEPAGKGGTGAMTMDGMETAPILDYEVPRTMPGVLISQVGYEPSAIKIAVVRGEKLPDSFRIVDASTGEAVYTGRLEAQGYDSDTGEYISYGDFTSWAEEGSYYLECDIVGRSYPFDVKSSLYEELMQNSLDIIAKHRENLSEEDVVEACRCISMLLLSYELFSQTYESGEEGDGEPRIAAEIKKYVEWLLSLQDAETGAVMTKEGYKREETAWLSAVLAKFSYTYQKFDSIYATACLQAADKAWKFLEHDGEDSDDELMFYAATELYRATGRYSYHAAAQSLGENLVPDAQNEVLVLGTLTYAATKRKVNVDLCAGLTGVLFEEAEKIAELSKEDAYMAGSSLEKNSLDDILFQMVVVASIDYIITNHEYATLLEKHHNYLAGENAAALCYVDSGECSAKSASQIGENSVNTARYILILSEIMSHGQEE